MDAGRAPARRAPTWAPGARRVDSPLRRFLLEALGQNSPEKVIAAVRAMRSAGFEGEVMAEVRPYLGWEGRRPATDHHPADVVSTGGRRPANEPQDRHRQWKGHLT